VNANCRSHFTIRTKLLATVPLSMYVLGMASVLLGLAALFRVVYEAAGAVA
jgi:hypothetical protein